jgi:hypothetical protein
MAGNYNPAKKLIERFPRFSKKRKEWFSLLGRATLRCRCGEALFRVQMSKMERQRRTTTASHRKIVTVCLNPKCKQEIRLDNE